MSNGSNPLPHKVRVSFQQSNVDFEPANADKAPAKQAMKANEHKSMEGLLEGKVSDANGNPTNTVNCWVEYNPATGEYEIVCEGTT